MDLSKCKLYNLQRKRDLYLMLGFFNKNSLKENINKYKPYIEVQSKKRLIEPTLNKNSKLAIAQKKVTNLLQEIDYDDYVFSGVKGRSYISNGKYHLGCRELVAIDMRKFYPNTHREKVYKFFRDKMLCNNDIANILTNLLTINLEKVNQLDPNVLEYVMENNIKALKHLPTGVSTSSLLSYLSNLDMFTKINNFCKNNGYKMSVYIDDIVVSSTKKIHMANINKIINILEKQGYSISYEKLKFYGANEYKRVTGAIISKDGQKLVLPNKIRMKKKGIKMDKSIPTQLKKNKLTGYEQIEKQIFLHNKMYKKEKRSAINQ